MQFDVEIKKHTGMRILVSVCSTRDWKPHFGIRFANMIVQTTRRGNEISLVDLDLRGGASQSNLSAARQAHIDHAMQAGYTHIAMFDDDMMFPGDTILRLAKHGLPFVFANVAQKVPNKVNGVCLDLENVQRIDSTGRTGVEQVAYGTLACTLIEVEQFRHIPRPHFAVEWDAANNRYQGEDHYFFQKLGRAGRTFWMDNDLSQEVYHVGDYPYGFTQMKF